MAALALKNTPSAVAFFHDPDLSMAAEVGGGGAASLLAAPQKAKAAQVNFDFSATGSPQYQLSYGLADIGLYAWQGVFIDNSLSPAPTTIYITGTNQTISAPAFSQGYYRVMAGNQKIEALVTNYAQINSQALSNIVSVQFLNLMPEGADTWNLQSYDSLQGTPFFYSSTLANTTVTLTVSQITGRRTFITGIIIRAGGATAENIVDVQVTGLDNQFTGSSTMHIPFSVPADPNAQAVPAEYMFNPGLPVKLGTNCVLTFSAVGAGNTNQAASIMGFYQ